MPRPKKGEKTPGSGRKPGTPNKITREIKERIGLIFESPEGWKAYAEKFRRGELDSTLMVRLLEWQIGKPKERVSIEAMPPLMVISELDE